MVVAGLVVVVVDQITKARVRDSIGVGDLVEIFGDTVALTHSHNEGIALGLFGFAAPVLVFVTLAVAVVMGVVFARMRHTWLTSIAAGCIIGGAVGNLIDRARLEYVTDFIVVPIIPTFNVADIGITCGVAALVIALVLDAPEAAASEGQP